MDIDSGSVDLNEDTLVFSLSSGNQESIFSGTEGVRNRLFTLHVRT